jgi:signal transduction histidine kinase
LESLRDLTRGVFPTQLARSGIEPALRSFLGRADSPAQLLVDPSVAGERFAPRVEAAVYFCCVEAVRTAPEVTVIELALDGAQLRQRVHGVAGLDLQAVEDRVEAVGGTLALVDDVLEVTIPVGTAPAYSRLVEGAVPGSG